MSYGPNELLTRLLKDVSRSFYLTLRILPASVRSQIGLAYLLARSSDTIADTALVPPERRLDCLARFRARVLGENIAKVNFDEMISSQVATAERVLLSRCEESLTLLNTLEARDSALVREVLRIIISGQELDLKRFAEATRDQPVSLRTENELDDYTYRVAGCVGEFWTRICREHVFPKARLDDNRLLENGARFGKGLQLVNILRDLPMDLNQGRCYLPEEGLERIGLSVQDLLDPVNEPRVRPLFERYLNIAEEHLAAGWEYTNTLPYRYMRVRLACAWPILIGRDTLHLLRRANSLDPKQKVKVSRADVRRVVARSVLLYPFPQVWQRMAGFRA